MKKGFKAVIHYECGEPAFLAVDMIWNGSTQVTAEKLAHLKGRVKYTDETIVLCESCGAKIADLSATHDNHIIAISTNEGYRKYWTKFREEREEHQLYRKLHAMLDEELQQRKG